MGEVTTPPSIYLNSENEFLQRLPWQGFSELTQFRQLQYMHFLQVSHRTVQAVVSPFAHGQRSVCVKL